MTALNNQKASVKLIEERVFFQRTQGQVVISGQGPVVEQEPTFEANVIELGAVLDLTAHISDDGWVTLMLHPSFSELTGIVTSPAGDTAPEINRRELDTTVRVRSGDTVVLSGLMFNRRQSQREGIPLIGRLPFVGFLFRKTNDNVSKREMVLMISPQVQTAGNSGQIVKEAMRELRR